MMRYLFVFCLIVALDNATIAQPPADGKTLRVLAYNIHHGEGTDGKVDLPRLANVIKAAMPDLVALQEVDKKVKRTGYVDQLAELAKLTGMHGTFGKQIPYDGGDYGQAILSRTEIGEQSIHLLPGMPDREQRIAYEVRVTVHGETISFVSTHLHHANAAFREEQATKLNELFAKADRPVILAGDLNANPDSKPLDILDKQWKRATADPKLWTFPAVKPTKQIDYILFKPANRFKVLEAKVINEAVASDHRPILAVLEFLPK
jgi:endonuclease/exonuclease/phosphatase family metal-dependent hydrolase